MGIDKVKRSWYEQDDAGKVTFLDIDDWNRLKEAEKFTRLAAIAGIERKRLWLKIEENEKQFHIYYPELLALFFAIQRFCAHHDNEHVQIRSDNTIAISNINTFWGL